jgi:hypothetical protein
VTEKGKKKGRHPKQKLDVEPVWCAKYNFLCLLNLPEVVEEFGSPRNYFEGKFLGERYVQDVKNTRMKCPPRNVLATLLQKLHEGKGMEALVETQSKSLRSYRMTEHTNTKRKSLRGNVRIYPNLGEAQLSFFSGKALSAIKTSEKGIGLLFYENGSNKGEVKFVALNWWELEVSDYHGLRYWRWSLTNTISAFLVDDDNKVEDFLVLLPRSGEDSPGQYTMVTKEWSPEMLGQYNYSDEGMDVKMDEARI